MAIEKAELMVEQKKSRPEIHNFITLFYRNLFSCDYLTNPNLIHTFRRMVLDPHSCTMLSWLPRNAIADCVKNEFSPAVLESGQVQCLEAKYRIVKTIRFRGAFARVPDPTLIQPFRFIHLVRRPIAVAFSRFKAGWYSSNPSAELLAVIAKDASIPSTFRLFAGHLLTVMERVCQQQFLTQETIEADISPDKRLLLFYEQTKDAPHQVLMNVTRFLGYNGTLSLNKIQDAASRRYMSIRAKEKESNTVNLLPDHEWEAYGLRLFAICRLAYKRFGYTPLSELKTTSTVHVTTTGTSG